MSEAGKEYGVFVKDLREQKYNRFVANILPQLKCSNEVVDIVEKDYSFCVVTRTNGAIDFTQRRMNFSLETLRSGFSQYVIGCINIY